MKKSFSPNLEDKQSVRTTFRLSEEASKDIAWFAKKNRITQKEVFDHLFVQTLLNMEGDKNSFFHTILTLTEGSSYDLNRSVRKAQVISRKALKTLNEISKKHNLSRDVLVEYSVRLLKKLLEKRTEIRKEAAKLYKEEFQDKLPDIYSVESKLRDLLGDDDPIVEKYGYIVSSIQIIDDEIMAEIEELEAADTKKED